MLLPLIIAAPLLCHLTPEVVISDRCAGVASAAESVLRAAYYADPEETGEIGQFIIASLLETCRVNDGTCGSVPLPEAMVGIEIATCTCSSGSLPHRVAPFGSIRDLSPAEALTVVNRVLPLPSGKQLSYHEWTQELSAAEGEPWTEVAICLAGRRIERALRLSVVATGALGYLVDDDRTVRDEVLQLPCNWISADRLSSISKPGCPLRRDGWGQELLLRTCQGSFEIRSFGADGLPDPTEPATGRFSSFNDPREDIIYRTGGHVASPRGISAF